MSIKRVLEYEYINSFEGIYLCPARAYAPGRLVCAGARIQREFADAQRKRLNRTRKVPASIAESNTQGAGLDMLV